MPGASSEAFRAEHADEPELERRFRRRADTRVVAHLVSIDFDPASREWAVVRDALAEYGFAVLKVWLANGVARRQALQYAVLGAGVIPARLDGESADSIAADVAVDGVDRFRTHVLAAGRWDPAGGASLATFFVRFLLMRLPNAVRARARARRGVDESAGGELPDVEDAQVNAEDLAVIDAELSEAITLLGDADLVDVFRVLAAGHSYAEIASMLDRTTSQVKSQVMRARAQVRADTGNV
jgi:hypothetical protein